METDIQKIRLDRANRKIEILEKLIEDKTREVFHKNEQLQSTNQQLTKLYRVMPGALLVFSCEGRIIKVNKATLDLLKYTDDTLTGKDIGIVSSELKNLIAQTSMCERVVQLEQSWISSMNEQSPVLVSISCLDEGEEAQKTFVCIGSDLKERKQLELDLRHAQKLESIGQLAAGIAHEINTPMQFIGDNIHFLQDSFSDILELIEAYSELKKLVPKTEVEKVEEIESLEENADIEYVKERGPIAFERALNGISRVSEIVSAMKAFSHPMSEKTPVDLNEAIKTTLIVCKSEYKYIADLKVDYGSLPPVYCQVGDINQVILNLVVNSAHAISEKKLDGMGCIEVSTYATQKTVIIRISDNGNGIPKSIRHSVFDPFFTTKPVGKGTGQGLSLAYKIIVDGHAGSLRFESEEGIGTSFFIELPIRPAH